MVKDTEKSSSMLKTINFMVKHLKVGSITITYTKQLAVSYK